MRLASDSNRLCARVARSSQAIRLAILLILGYRVYPRGYRVVDTLSSSSGLNNETTNEIELNNEFRKLVRMSGRGAKRPRGVPHEVRKGSPNWPLIVVVATVRGQKIRIGILLTHVLREITK